MFPPDPIPDLTSDQEARLAAYRRKRRVPLAPWRVRLGWWWMEWRLRAEEAWAVVLDFFARIGGDRGRDS